MKMAGMTWQLWPFDEMVWQIGQLDGMVRSGKANN